MKLQDINNEVLVVFMLAILEFFAIGICGTVMSFSLTELNGDSGFALIASVVIWGFGIILEGKTLRAGLRVITYKKKQKRLIASHERFNIGDLKLKKESHYPTRHAGDRYYRYYLIGMNKNPIMKKSKLISCYYDEKSAEYFRACGMQVYYDKTNPSDYILVPDL